MKLKKTIRRARRNRIPSVSEMETRRYHKDLRELKDKCELLNVTLRSFDDADYGDKCILSRNEFDIGETRVDLEESYESYFVSCDVYDKYFSGYEK